LEIKERIENGSKEDAKHLRKHKADVFRLIVMLTPESIFELPETIQNHIDQFTKLTAGDLPDKAVFKEMELNNIDPKTEFEQFKKSFKVSFNIR